MSPFRDKNDQPVLKRCVFVFADLLGFQEMSRQAEKKGTSQTLLTSLHQALNHGQSLIDARADHIDGIPDIDLGYRVKTFTDNVIFAWPIAQDGELELGNTFMRFAEYQLALALNGFFVRGGLSVGDACVDDSFVFGPALSEAYQLESKAAVFPRILLSPEAEEMAEKHAKYHASKASSHQNSILARDPDGTVFLSYLEAACPDENDSVVLENYRTLVEKHRDAIITKLKQHKKNRRVWEKYIWSANYHNFAVRRLYGTDPRLEIAPLLTNSTPGNFIQ